MITVADIQKDFPDWPADVIEPWLIEFANDPDMGWPPPEPYGDHRWGRLLGQRPIWWWKNVTWTLEKTDCGFDGLTPKARAEVLDIRREMEGGNASPATKRRWDNLFRYVLNDGSFPVPPVVMRRPEGLSPIDGTHRMAVQRATSVAGSGFRREEAGEAVERAERLDWQTQGRRTSERAVRRPSLTAISKWAQVWHCGSVVCGTLIAVAATGACLSYIP